DRLVWPHAVESADKESWRLAFEAAMMSKEEREKLVIVGHSLGGRITARILSRLAEHGLKVRQASLMAAAIPNGDPDLAKMGGGSELPVLAVCNPDDVTLRYVYTLAGGESAVAFGANGTLKPIANVKECVTPKNITEQVKIDAEWGKVESLKKVANHCELFYIDYLRRLLGGEAASGEVMVPQALPTVEGKVMDCGLWWDTLAETNGWKLQRNKVTGHGRIIDPEKVRKAWGGVEEMAKSFEKVRGLLDAGK
ncbi:MAG: alpha/beta hydrolase, partial [Kiritimatiellae bacterium]|nr:alpha/beta hydrolase [Kiritimatiellia bacterium]